MEPSGRDPLFTNRWRAAPAAPLLIFFHKSFNYVSLSRVVLQKRQNYRINLKVERVVDGVVDVTTVCVVL